MGRKTYTASAQVYLSNTGEMVYPGDKFTVDDDMPIGETWLTEDGEPIDPEVIEASKAKAKAKAEKTSTAASKATAASARAEARNSSTKADG